MADSDAIASSFARTLRSAPRKRRRWVRILLYTLATLLLLLAALVAGWVLWIRAAERASLPQLDGSLRLPGLSAPVTVRRDIHGVPYIQAATQDDLFTAQGYVTAQDRLWQMDLWRRNANGELAEVLGPSLVQHDRVQRILGFRRAAERIYVNLDADDRRRLDDYARGVNAFIQQDQDRLPGEFRMLLYKPKPWRGADSLSVATMMIDMLDTHWNVKVERERIRAKLNNSNLESELYPVGSWRDHPPTGDLTNTSGPQPAQAASSDDETASLKRVLSENGQPVRAGVSELRAVLGLPDLGNFAPGSNNWVIAGSHTANGLPLLSNDMHLPIETPGIWWMAGLEAPGLHVEGVTLPGIPGVVAGHNQHVAWGFTALYADVQDVYVEKLDGQGHYQALDGRWQPLATDREIIHVRGGKDVTLDVVSTAHGPIVTPIIPGESRPLSLKWTLYDPSLHGLAIYAMNTASNWTEFSAAVASWDWPTQNVVYADDQGHIGYRAVGKVPLRPAGLQPAPIPDNSHEWAGYIPFEAMPNAFDPPSGFLGTANARVTTDKSPYPLSLEWVDPYRTERIYKSLQGRSGLTPQRHAGDADRYLQRSGPGTGAPVCLRHRPCEQTG